MQGQFKVAMLEGDGMMDRDQFCAVGESAFHLHFFDHTGDPTHDFVATQKLASEIHQLGDRLPVPDELEQLRGNQCHRFRVIEAHTAGQALLSEKPSVMQNQLVQFTRGKVHNSLPFSNPGMVWFVEHAQQSKMAAQFPPDIHDTFARQTDNGPRLERTGALV